jgi:sodium transport system permease protein
VTLIPGLLVTEWALVLGPVLLLIQLRSFPLVETLRLIWPRRRVVAGALLAGASGWYVVGVLVEQLQNRILPVPPDVLEAMRQLVSGSERLLVVDLVALALSPALCEELLFRGFLVRATEGRLSAPVLVLTNALLFGAFHLSPYRLLPTATLGLVLALLALRTGSVVPAVLFHLLNNTFTLLVGRFLEGADGALEIDPLHAMGAALLFAVGLSLALGRPKATS